MRTFAKSNRILLMLAVAPLFVSSAATAQTSPLVNVDVDVQDFLNDLNLDVDVNLENVVVQVPVNVAANVCGVDVNILSQQASSGSASCTAVNVNEPTVVQAVQQEVATQTGGETGGSTGGETGGETGNEEDCTPHKSTTAPGQEKKADAAKAAPGQVKKACPEPAAS